LGGRYDELTELADRLALHKNPEFVQRWRKAMELATRRHQGQYARLLELLPEELETVSYLRDAAISHYFLANQDQARKYLDQLIAIVDERTGDYSVVAAALAQMDEPDRAIEYLNNAVDSREVNSAFIRVDPDFRPLYDDPRFLQLLERAGLKPPPPG
jgi:tetratricopeptide (TPR) repeat protein